MARGRATVVRGSSHVPVTNDGRNAPMAARQLGRPDLVRTNRDWPKLDLQTCVTGSAVLPTVATVADRDGVTLVTISRHDHPMPADAGPQGASTVVVIDGDVDGDTGCL